jgi:hypothetical protein
MACMTANRPSTFQKPYKIPLLRTLVTTLEDILPVKRMHGSESSVIALSKSTSDESGSKETSAAVPNLEISDK